MRARAARRTAPGPKQKRALWSSAASASLIIFDQVHALIKARYLVAVAVEHQSVAPAEFPEAPFLGLAPARVRPVGVDVGIKTVLIGSVLVPRGGRLAADELDFHNRFDALKAIFPGDHQTHRRTVLRGQGRPVHPDAEQGQR